VDRPRAPLEALAAYLPELESPGYVAGTWRGGERGPDGVIQMPWFEDSDRGLALRGAIGAAGMVVTGFDWMRWLDSPEGAALRDEPGAIERASEEDLAHLLTAIVRGDRFSEGNVAGAIESGVMARILRRLRDLLDAGESPG
jgi:hypothetical protein